MTRIAASDTGMLPSQFAPPATRVAAPAISSHVLRHSCGYKLANDGRDTVRYAALAPDRFKDFWKD